MRLFVTEAVPEVAEWAVTARVTTSPGEKEMPVKSKATAGYHSYQAEIDRHHITSLVSTSAYTR